MYKLIGTDFDGTLLNDQKQVSEENIKYLEFAREKGIIVVAVTGRTLESAKSVVDINMFDYLGLNNGVNIFDVNNKSFIYNNYIDSDLVRQITCLTDTFARNFSYCSYKSYNILKDFKDNGIDFVKGINSLDELTEPVSKINIYLKDEDELLNVYNLLMEKFRNLNVSIMQESGNDNKWIVVAPEKIDKSHAFIYLGKFFDISISDMIFFGDGLNDIKAIETVGMGVAMGNALDAVIEKADDITLSNNDNGIAYFIKNKVINNNLHI